MLQISVIPGYTGMAEVLQARLPDSLSTLLGPYVVWEPGEQEPFAPHGLAIWQLPVSKP